MLKIIREHHRAFVLIPCLGILFAALCGVPSSDAKEITFEKMPSQDSVAPQDSLVPSETLLQDIKSIAVSRQGEGQKNDNSFVPPVIDNAYGDEQENFGPEDLVLAVYANKQKLSSGIFAIQSKGQYYLPLAALSEVLGFHYDVDLPRRFVEGWALSEDDSYAIDAQNRILRFRGEKFDLPSESILDEAVVDDDIYVLIDVLPQIWPLQLDVNLSSLILKIIPDGKLPFQLALDRKAKRDRAFLSKEDGESQEDFLFVPYPYKAYSKPTIDISSFFEYDEVENEPVASMSLNGINDLAYASADYSTTLAQRGGEFHRPQNIRFRLRRQNIHEGALPFGLEDTQLGDVRLRNRDLISTGAGGRGFVFTTEKDKKLGEFDLVTIEGIGTPAWEVELYLNNELINFGVIDDRGEYRFEDISVGFGNNRFRIVLYGPQGQVKERVENYIYQSSMIKKGKNVLSGGIVDANKDLIPIEYKKRGTAEGLTANFYAARGLTEKLTGFVTANTVRDKEGKDEISREYLSAGAVGSMGSTIAQLEAYKQLDGGSAVDVRTLSDFFGFKVNTQISKFYDFESPDARSGLNAKDLETEIGIKRTFRTLIGSLGLELRHNYLERESGTNTSKYIARQSLGVKGVRMTNSLTTNLSDGSHRNTTGRLGATVRQNGWTFRNNLNYTFFPDSRVTSLQSELRRGHRRNYTTALRANYNLINDEKRLGFQIGKDFKKFLGSAEAEWSSVSGVGVALRASTSLGPYAEGEKYAFKSTPLTSVGPVGSTVYMDKNYNNVYDEGDEPVDSAKIVFNRRVTKERTNENGHLMELISIGAGKTNIKVAKESIDDPYLIPSVPGYSVHPRAGAVQKLEFPLIETGAIDGTLRWDEKGKPIAGVNLQLLNEEADIVKLTRTAVDGYFTFERIPPGNYTIRPDPADGLDIPFKYVNLTKDNLFQFGTDIYGTPDGSTESVDLGIEVGKDGALNVKNILSLAKGYKDKKRGKVYKASTSNDELKNKVTQISSGHSQKSNIKKIRIGNHPNKVRVVMDLSAPLEYSINFEPQSNTVFVEMPYASWSASNSWDSQGDSILNNYRIEKLDQGVRLILGVENGVDIGASGLLKASGDKKDRLYIDIEKK